MVTVIFALQCTQAVYQLVRDVRYVRLAVAGVRWLILWVLCGLYRFCRGFCGLCTACEPGRLCERVWVYTPSLAWETDRNAANSGFQLNQLENRTRTLGQQPRMNLALKAYRDGGVTYYVDEENEQRLRFYLGVRRSTTYVEPDRGNLRPRGVFMLNIRMLFPGLYIGIHKSSGSDYYEECMSGCAFRAVKCRLVVDPDPAAPIFSMILKIVSVASLIARPKGTKAVIILGVVLALDVFRSLLVRPWLMKLLTCVEFWLKSMISNYCSCSYTPCLILLLESIFDERMKNPSQYTNSYARLNGVALLGNGSRVACNHEVIASQISTPAPPLEAVVINFDRAAIRIARPAPQQRINLEWHTDGTRNQQGVEPEIRMNGQDDYDDVDWSIVRERMRFAAEHHLFPVWSIDERQAHCKDIKYDFFNGRYHKGCVIRLLGNPTRVVGGDFDLPAPQPDQPRAATPGAAPFGDATTPLLS